MCSPLSVRPLGAENIHLLYVLHSREWKQSQCFVPVSCLLIGSFCHVLTGTWRPPTQPCSLWGSSLVEQRAPTHGDDRKPRAQASPCPHSKQPEDGTEGWMMETKDIRQRPWMKRHFCTLAQSSAYVQMKHTLISPSSTNKDDTKS